MQASARLTLSLVAFGLIAPSCMFDSYSAKATERLTVKYVPATAIEVTSRNGRIEIIGGQRGEDIVVEASIVAGGRSQEEADDRLDGVKIHCRRDEQDRLIVKAEFPGERRNRDGVSYVIELPDADGAKLSTSNGSIKVPVRRDRRCSRRYQPHGLKRASCARPAPAWEVRQPRAALDG